MARSPARNTKSKATVKVDFTGVESSGHVQEGRQVLTVSGVPEIKTSDSSGNDYINWKFKATGGTVYHTTSLQPQALWNLRNTLEALGLEVPESAMELDLSELDGLTCGGEIENETYQGKKRPRIIDLFPESELDGETAPSGKVAAEPEAAEEDPTWEELQEMDKDELIELAGEYDLELTVKVKRNVDTLRAFIAEALELEAPEEEPEAAPATTTRRKRGGSKELAVGSEVTFVDDGEDISGTVKSINTKEKFAVVNVEGEEWEVELSDLTVA